MKRNHLLGRQYMRGDRQVGQSPGKIPRPDGGRSALAELVKAWAGLRCLERVLDQGRRLALVACRPAKRNQLDIRHGRAAHLMTEGLALPVEAGGPCTSDHTLGRLSGVLDQTGRYALALDQDVPGDVDTS